MSGAFVPCVPDAGGIVAFGADHVVVAPYKLVGVVFQGLRCIGRRAVELHVEIPQEVGGVVVGTHAVPPKGIAPNAIMVELHAVSIERRQSLVECLPVGARAAAACACRSVAGLPTC